MSKVAVFFGEDHTKKMSDFQLLHSSIGKIDPRMQIILQEKDYVDIAKDYFETLHQEDQDGHSTQDDLKYLMKIKCLNVTYIDENSHAEDFTYVINIHFDGSVSFI